MSHNSCNISPVETAGRASLSIRITNPGSMSSVLPVKYWKKSKRSIDRQRQNRWNMLRAFLIESNYDLSGDRLVRIDSSGKHRAVSNVWTCQMRLRLAPWVCFEGEETIPYRLREVSKCGSVWQISVSCAAASWSQWCQEETVDHINEPWRFIEQSRIVRGSSR